jgi:transposase-like protein
MKLREKGGFMSRKKFNKEFKVAAVKLVLDDALPVS